MKKTIYKVGDLNNGVFFESEDKSEALACLKEAIEDGIEATDAEFPPSSWVDEEGYIPAQREEAEEAWDCLSDEERQVAIRSASEGFHFMEEVEEEEEEEEEEE